MEGCDEVQCVVFEVIFDLFDVSGRLSYEGVGEIRESLSWRFLKEAYTCHKILF